MNRTHTLSAVIALAAAFAVFGSSPLRAEPDQGGCRSCQQNYDAYVNIVHTDYFYFHNLWHGGAFHNGMFGACSEYHAVYST